MFSILLPTFNRSALLKRSLDSLKAQSFSEFEVFILDDHSSDDTQKVASEYIKNDTRFRYIRFEINHSQGVILMNFIVKNHLNKFKYILCFGDDDYLNKDFLLECSKCIKLNPDIVVSDLAYDYGGIVLKQAYDGVNLESSKNEFVKQKICQVYSSDFYIKNDVYAIKNGETCEPPIDRFCEFANFAYAKNAFYIFALHSGNRRKYLRIDNFIMSISSLCLKDCGDKIDKTIFIKNWNIRFIDESSFLFEFTQKFSQEILDELLSCEFKDFAENTQAIAKKYSEKYQAEYDKKYEKLNAKLYSYEQRNDIISSAKTFAVYCKSEWGEEIKNILCARGLKFTGFIDDEKSMNSQDFLRLNSQPDFVFIATGKPKLMGELIEKLSEFKGKILTLHEKDVS